MSTPQEGERLLRLPLFYNLPPVDQRTVITTLLKVAAPDMSLAKASCGRQSRYAGKIGAGRCWW